VKLSLKRFFKSNTHKEKHMNHFSQEFCDKLIAEHKLISASIANLQGPSYSRQIRVHSQTVVDSSLFNLRTKKVELEAMIDVLQDYLNG